jgi:microfibrillar-associated protein 1
MSTQTVRKQAPRLARPAARYWKGKAPKGVVDVDSDSDVEEAPQMEEEGDVPISGDQDIMSEEDDEEAMRIQKEVPKSIKAMNVTLKDVNISKDGKVIVGGREESGRTAVEEEEEDGMLTLLMLLRLKD